MRRPTRRPSTFLAYVLDAVPRMEQVGPKRIQEDFGAAVRQAAGLVVAAWPR